MKILILLSVFLFMSLLSKGMGYPQDMFAEHITVKTVEKKVVKQPVKGQFEDIHLAKPTTKVAHPPTRPPTQCCLPLQRLKRHQPTSISIKTFDLETDTVVEQTVLMNAIANKKWKYLAVRQAVVRSHQQFMAYLLWQLSSCQPWNTLKAKGSLLVLG
ncbi:MAG: hypothetical protein V4714_11585 [Bacteroidota bacterium]